MFENWLQPVQPESYTDTPYSPDQLGGHIRYFRSSSRSIKSVKLGLIGLDRAAADAIRPHLYRFSFPFKGLRIMDFGNARRRQVSFLVPAIREMMDSQILPILLGSTPAMMQAQYRAFKSLKELINQVIVDEVVPFRGAGEGQPRHYFHDIVHQKRSRLFHLGLVGCQSHYIPPSSYELITDQQFDLIRLGKARADLTELEPLIRDADLLSLHLAALKQAEAPAQLTPSPSGFTTEEACQICRYAGMSDKLRAFGLYGYAPDADRQEQTAQVIAQMIWYFIDGFYNRKQDFPVNTNGLVEYIVDFKGLDYQLTFWKSSKSGRWWMQIPVKTTKKYQRHRLIPCSYMDYKRASQDELPERLLRALERFS